MVLEKIKDTELLATHNALKNPDQWERWTDTIKILTSTEFQSKVAAAVADFSELPGEIRDLSALEGFEIREE